MHVDREIIQRTKSNEEEVKKIKEIVIREQKKIMNVRGMFFNCNLLKSIDLTKFDTKLITDMSCFIIVPLFQILDLSYTKKVTDMNHMFYKCSSIKSFDLSNFETYNITDMSEMFAECISLAYLDISNFKTYKVININRMFKGMMN